MKKKLFNDNWMFAEGSATTLSLLFNSTAGAENFTPPKPVMLPHDAMIETPRKDFFAGACTGFWEPKNVYYTKEFTLPAEDEGKAIWLEFESIFQFAFIYLNEQYVGRCMNGYTNYYVDITDYVVFDRPNQLKVVVRNGCESSRWYSGGGIYRNVHILKGDPLHVKCEGVRVRTETLEDGYALIEITTPVEYIGAKKRCVRVRNELLDRDGKLVASDSAPLTMQKGGCKEVHQKLNLIDPIVWDLENPYLYTCRTTILEGEAIVDTAETTFGIRRFQLDAVHGLRLNGKTIKLKGGCLHHDNGVVGAATFYECEERRLRRLQKAGYNAVRTGAHPFCRDVLEICDRIGMLVYDELCDSWTTAKVAFDYTFDFEANWERDLTNLILRDYNHPCVVFYGVGNEIQELDTPDGKDWARRLCQKVHALDKTRFATLSMNPIMPMMPMMGEIIADLQKWGAEAAAANHQKDCADAQEEREVNSTMNQMADQLDALWMHPKSSAITEEVLAQADITGLNYATGLYEIDHTRYPNRVMFGSETYPRYLARNWEIIERVPYVVGDFCWTAWDYLGEAGIGDVYHTENPKGSTEFYGNWPWKTAYVGAFDLIGDELPIGYWREIVWRNRTAPYIAVRPPQFYGKPLHVGNWTWISDAEARWNWAGYEGKPIQVEVFSRADEVELFINGKSVGKQKPGKDFAYVALFDTVYEPGEIKAVDSNGECFILQTALDESMIRTWVDPRELANRHREITTVEISICDANGVLNSASAKQVCIQVEGGGTLQGFGSADPLSTENFYDTRIRAYRGRLLAVIRHDGSKTPVNVRLSADGCKDTIIEI